MKPVGKTYLIKVKKQDSENNKIDGIYIPDTSSIHDVYYEGIIEEYGTGWKKSELKNLIPIGKTIFFEYKKKCGTKFVLGERIYYIHEPENILAIKES